MIGWIGYEGNTADQSYLRLVNVERAVTIASGEKYPEGGI